MMQAAEQHADADDAVADDHHRRVDRVARDRRRVRRTRELRIPAIVNSVSTRT
jgi:hypothetical protein